jgi:hypothetical protein
MMYKTKIFFEIIFEIYKEIWNSIEICFKMEYNMTLFKKFHIFIFKRGTPLHILVTISSIPFDKNFYGKYFFYHATQLIETNRLV